MTRMKFTRFLAPALLAALAFTSVAQTKSGAAAEKFFRDVDAAVAQHDGAAFERLLTDDFTFIAVTGDILERKQVLERQKAGVLMGGAANEILTVRSYGDTAIVTYRTKVPLNGGTTLIGTRVFVKQSGAWKWAFSQGTFVGGTLPALPGK